MSEIATRGDDELFRRLREGDEEAFLTVYHRCQGRIFRYALRMSGSRAVAEDVTQEVFMVLMGPMVSYDPGKGNLDAYLFGVARRQVLRSLSRERSVPLETELLAAGDPLEDLSRAESVERVRSALLSLPDAFKEAVVLCDLEGLSYIEVAEIAGCPVGTVRSRLHRGRRMLLEALSQVVPQESLASR